MIDLQILIALAVVIGIYGTVIILSAGSGELCEKAKLGYNCKGNCDECRGVSR